MYLFVLGVGLLFGAVPHYDWSGNGGWAGFWVTGIILLGAGMVWVGVRDLIASAFAKVAAQVTTHTKGEDK
jgi:hypothetical protein